MFPRHLKSIKKGDASKEEMANVQQIVGDIIAAPKPTDAVTFSAVTEVLWLSPFRRFLGADDTLFFQSLKSEKGYAALRRARSDARLVGIRMKQAKAAKDEKKDE